MSRSRDGGGPEGSRLRAPLSVLITARNEEDQLPHAIATVAGWADDVLVVVDSTSSDRSAEVAGAAGARVEIHPFTSSAAQCNWGLDRCTHDWVLVVDADERVTAELRAGIDRALASPRHAAYAVRRANLAFGRRLRFGDWGRDRIVRLVDRRQARFDERAVHGAIKIPSAGRVAGWLLHDTLRSFDQYLPKVVDYARRGAQDVGHRRVGAMSVAGRPLWRFFRAALLRGGVLDGTAGLVVALLAAYGTFLKWAMVWADRAGRAGATDDRGGP